MLSYFYFYIRDFQTGGGDLEKFENHCHNAPSKLLKGNKKGIIFLDSASLEIARNQLALSLIIPPASVLFKSCGCEHSVLCHNWPKLSSEALSK